VPPVAPFAVNVKEQAPIASPGRAREAFRFCVSIYETRLWLSRPPVRDAVKLQILAAMIAYLLLRLAAKASRSALSPLRFAELAGQCLFIRKPIEALDKPPDVNPSRPKPKCNPAQLELAYA
jgi:hypothetical protein